jgi:protoporphyrinogen oxidase
MASKQKTAVIIGAGPAGLTAAWELLARTEIRPLVLEATGHLGGISKTVNYKGNRIDIGGHRFFSKSERVMQWWYDVLPLQGRPARDDIAHGRAVPLSNQPGAPDPETTDNVLLVRERVSRILFLRKFFDYPLSLRLSTLAGLGATRTARIGLSYAKSCAFRVRPEKSLEDFLVNRFGRELYATFFRDYTEKVWGVPCDRIAPEWGMQRIKGLSIRRAVADAARHILARGKSDAREDTETSLIRQFLYPKLGPGQLWTEVARRVEARGGEVRLHQTVTGLTAVGERITAVTVRDEQTGATSRIEADYFLSTMPVKDLVLGLEPAAPAEVREVAAGLVYRDFITVGLLLDRLTVRNKAKDSNGDGTGLIPDCWVYIQEPDVKVGRIQIFNNWSPYLVADPAKVWIGLEYFCNEGDGLWRMPDGSFADFAIGELEKIGFARRVDVRDSTVLRTPKTYPAYFGTYDRFDVIRQYANGFENLFLVGRNGMHRYNNQDHSMLAAMTAVENIAAGVREKDNIWAVNTEEAYHEGK